MIKIRFAPEQFNRKADCWMDTRFQEDQAGRSRKQPEDHG